MHSKLQPPVSSPEEELCQCQGNPPVKVMSSALTYNPVHCMDCNREISSNRLALELALIDRIARWNAVYNAIDRLWLDSGAYEAWAKAQLEDIYSAVNQLGLVLREELNQVRRCYYWYFQDQAANNYNPPRICPICDDILQDYREGTVRQRVCEKDSIVVFAE